jgi:hypothetical protein
VPPDVPDAPELSELPEAPELPELPEPREVPELPEPPEAPEAPELPEVPDAPELPVLPFPLAPCGVVLVPLDGEPPLPAGEAGDADPSFVPATTRSPAERSPLTGCTSTRPWAASPGVTGT